MRWLSYLTALKRILTSMTASASNSSGISRPSLKLRGRSTSKRRQVVLIRCFSLDDKRDVLLGECLKSRFWNDVLSGFKRFSEKVLDQEAQSLFLGSRIRKR